jgi:hypothetical protein
MKIATLLLAAITLVAPATLFPQPPQKDVPAELDSARNSLKQAVSDLGKAGGEWGGHRQKAVEHIQQAVSELNQAEQWAKAHHDVK